MCTIVKTEKIKRLLWKTIVISSDFGERQHREPGGASIHEGSLVTKGGAEEFRV